MQIEQSDERLLKCAGTWIVEECPRDEAPQKGCSEVRIDGAAALDQLLKHSARILADFISHGGLVDTGDAAERRTFLDDRVLPFLVLARVFCERDAAVPALLRAPMHTSILADMEEARAGAVVPRIRKAADEIFLETVVVSEREDTGFEPADLLINAELALRKSAALPSADGASDYRGRRVPRGARGLKLRSLAASPVPHLSRPARGASWSCPANVRS